MDFNALLALLEETRRALDAGEPVELARCERAVQRALLSADKADPAQVRALRDAVDGVVAAAEEQQVALDDRIRDLVKRRDGVRGYAHLRPHHKAQKLFKRA